VVELDGRKGLEHREHAQDHLGVLTEDSSESGAEGLVLYILSTVEPEHGQVPLVAGGGGRPAKHRVAHEVGRLEVVLEECERFLLDNRKLLLELRNKGSGVVVVLVVLIDKPGSGVEFADDPLLEREKQKVND
jgi:hypothetical protein